MSLSSARKLKKAKSHRSWRFFWVWPKTDHSKGRLQTLCFQGNGQDFCDRGPILVLPNCCIGADDESMITHAVLAVQTADESTSHQWMWDDEEKWFTNVGAAYPITSQWEQQEFFREPSESFQVMWWAFARLQRPTGLTWRGWEKPLFGTRTKRSY